MCGFHGCDVLVFGHKTAVQRMLLQGTCVVVMNGTRAVRTGLNGRGSH